MRNFIRENQAAVWTAIGLLAVALAAPALAGTVYSWTTDDGTQAFTDDAKRIPARYKEAAKSRQMGKLKNYPRLTESKVKVEKPYEERVDARLETLRQERLPAVSAAPPGAETRLDIGIGAQDQLSVPIGETAAEEPIAIEDHRVRTRDSIATRDVRVVKQGDEVVSVTVSKRNEGPIGERNVPDPENRFK